MLNTSEMEEFERELEMENADQAGDPESNPSSKSSASNMQPTNSKFEPYQNYDPNHEPGNYSPRFLASNRKTIHLTQSDVVSLQKSPTHSSMNDSSEQPASGFFRSWFNCF